MDTLLINTVVKRPLVFQRKSSKYYIKLSLTDEYNLFLVKNRSAIPLIPTNEY